MLQYIHGGDIMRKVVLNMKQEREYQIIKKLVETNGNKKSAALKLDCSLRTINRKIAKYKQYGKAAFIHGNTGRKPATTISEQTRQTILDLFNSPVYLGVNITHFTELLEEVHDIKVSKTTVRSILFDNDILSPKAKRLTRKKLKNILQARKDKAKTINEAKLIDDRLESLDREDAHPRRPRCRNKGELIQMDASDHEWISGQRWSLHLAVDDATGLIVGAYFDKEETLNGYYNVMKQVLGEYGVPHKILTDKRTVFTYKNKKMSSDEQDTYTQFAYACMQLGIELESTSVPQAKGRVERLNQTLQSRLIIELRMASVSTLEEANDFLKTYIPKFNNHFALPVNCTRNAFEKQLNDEKINHTLAILSNRKIDAGHCIKFRKKYYIPTNDLGTEEYFPSGTKALVVETFNKELYVNIGERLYLLKEIPKHADKTLKELEEEKKATVKKQKTKQHIPPLTHPWRSQAFIAHVRKQNHRIGIQTS